MREVLVNLLITALLVLGGLPGCGGGGGGGITTSPPGTSPGTPPSTDPCAGVAEEAPAVEPSASAVSDKRWGVYGDTGWSWLDHRWTRSVARRVGVEDVGVQPTDRDAGAIAIIEDNGQLVARANRFDLGGRGLRFSPVQGGGYEVATADASFRSPLGARLTLADDDASSQTVPFAFPFFGRQQTAAFVNSDGNLTFGAGETASTARNVTRFLTGPPRVALFFADLDPSAAGSVWVNAGGSAFTVTWCAVPGYGLSTKATVQATLLPDGSVEMRFGGATTLDEAIVGVSPGATTDFMAADLTAGARAGATAGLGEKFSPTADLDLEGASRRFLGSHPDEFDQLIFWTDQRVVSDAFAFETTIANGIRGLGIGTFDESRAYGSNGRLTSIVLMDTLTKYPDDPQQVFLGENSTVSVIGQEVGHRWLTFFRFLDVNRQASEALLGRDQAHWGFFVDSDASVMEGNDIEDLGGGSFRTVGAVNRFSRADLYAMGLVGPGEVPTFFYVESPVNTNPSIADNSSAPRVGVTFNGTRRDVRLQDIIDVMGARQPGTADAPKVWRQAFIYVVGGGRTAEQAQIDKLDRIRAAWETFYSEATERRGRVDTRLR